VAETLQTYQVPEHHVKAFTSNVMHAVQREGGIFRSRVTPGSYSGETAQVVNLIGEVAFTKRTTRAADTVLSEVEHKQRWIAPGDWDFHVLVDSLDKLRMLYDPMNPYVEAARKAALRCEDTDVLGSFFAAALTGKLGASTTVYTAGNTIAHGGTGLTLAKLRALRKLMKQQFIDIQVEKPMIAVTAEDVDDLLGETQIQSADYNSIKALVDGEVKTFMGFEFVPCEEIVAVASTRTLPAWLKSGMHLGDWATLSTIVVPRADKNNIPQLSMNMTFGSTRLEEKKVFAIETQ